MMHATPPAAGKSFDGCPGYVRGWCCKARERTLAQGYRDVGYLLAGKLRMFRPSTIGPAAWIPHLCRLSRALRTGDRRAALLWFHRTYPGLMAIIPIDRHTQFVTGVAERLTG